MKERSNSKVPKIICDEAGAVKNANGLCVSSGDMDVNMGYIGVDPSDAARDIATEQMSATAGAAQSGQGAANVLDGRADTLWHTTSGVAMDVKIIGFNLN